MIDNVLEDMDIVPLTKFNREKDTSAAICRVGKLESPPIFSAPGRFVGELINTVNGFPLSQMRIKGRIQELLVS